MRHWWKEHWPDFVRSVFQIFDFGYIIKEYNDLGAVVDERGLNLYICHYRPLSLEDVIAIAMLQQEILVLKEAPHGARCGDRGTRGLRGDGIYISLGCWGHIGVKVLACGIHIYEWRRLVVFYLMVELLKLVLETQGWRFA